MDALVDLLKFSLLPGVSPAALKALRARGPLTDVLRQPDLHGDLLKPDKLERLLSSELRAATEKEISQAAKRGVTLVGLDDPLYPPLLHEIYDPPGVLFTRGALIPHEGAEAVAIVGSRKASAQGLAFARVLARDLAQAGLTIVSGLARGVDTAAHEGALEADGRTVAILGSGLNRLYPPENKALAERIEKKGAVVSELPLDTPPAPYHFPRRNRLIAGWGRLVVIVEAGERSGALVTARLALDEGREVMAVPGHPGYPGATGTNLLIRDGATLVRHADDVLEGLGIMRPTTPAAPAANDPLLAALRRDTPCSLEDLQARCGQPIPELLARLTELELLARVRRLPGPSFVRS
ncbi:MAG: DNA-processing protein DprA [Vicinamibacteria bacterium]|nr:DNA-processing protein DprA [Vicinamibacteria bacterium]